MAKDKLCNILYHMVKHDWREALHKSCRTASNMTIMELEEYFEQIELLGNLKQKGSEIIVVDDDSDSKKLSKKRFGGAESTHYTTDCKHHTVVAEKASGDHQNTSVFMNSMLSIRNWQRSSRSFRKKERN
eukprot:8615693-Ditylum_brightwellii.AAC.1